MKQKKPPPDPHLIFKHALGFYGTDIFLRGKSFKPLHAMIAGPSMVISAFTSELFLKCILAIDGERTVETHRLNVLFRRLKHKRQRRIIDIWESGARQRITEVTRINSISDDLPNLLFICGDAFKQIRYMYEDPDSVRFYLGDLPKVLLRTVVEIKPEWDPATQPTFPGLWTPAPVDQATQNQDEGNR